LSGRVTTATTSNPSPSKASSEGTANSGVPKKTTRTLQLARRLRRDLLQIARLAFARLFPLGEQQAPFHSAQMIEEQHTIQVIDLVLDGAGLVRCHLHAIGLTVAIERLERDLERPLHLPIDLRDREAALFGHLHDIALANDPGIDEHQRRRIVFTHVDHGHAPRDADLVRREPDALGRAHRFEQIVHQAAYLVVHGGDVRRALPEHRRAEEVELANGHCDFASTVRLRMLAMLERCTMRRDSALRIWTSSSFRCTPSPMMPPEVTIRSPRWSDSSSWRCRSCWRRWGRISMK